MFILRCEVGWGMAKVDTGVDIRCWTPIASGALKSTKILLCYTKVRLPCFKILYICVNKNVISMTEEEIKAADLILKYATPTGITVKRIQIKVGVPEVKQSSLHSAALYLKDDGLIEIDNSSTVDHAKLKLTSPGLEFKASEKRYADYLVEKAEKAKKQSIKEDMDWKHKKLQVQDLITKLNEINPEQLDFWRSQKKRNKQATAIAAIGLLFSLMALLKSFGIL